VKSQLIWKLLFINLIVIGVVMVIVWVSIDTLAAGYFVTLMERYHISPEPAHDMFVNAVHRYLIWASLAAALVAIILNFFMMRRILSPLTRMTTISRQISAGDFNGRVPETTSDEVGQLARDFNRMAESLEKIENLRRGLMIDVTHELRTPLTNMRGYLEALNDGVLPPSEETFNLLHEETLRLVNLVEDVLRLARADAARNKLQRDQMDLIVLIQEMLMVFANRFEEKKIKVNEHISDRLPLVFGDRNQIARVIRNLFDNAIQYTPENSSLEIHVVLLSNHIQVAMTNACSDIRQEDIPFIFERFFRGEKSRSREHGGAGIGLAIVKELVEAHDGKVGAELKDDQIKIWFDLPISPNFSSDDITNS
jgi:two-component system sensor histidine kinase BaeS